MSPNTRLAQVHAHLQQPHFSTQARSITNLASKKANGSISCTIRDLSPGNTVATITISYPAKLNIVNSPILDQLITTTDALATDPSLRAVILTGGPPNPGKPPSFIGGADLAEMHRLSSAAEARTFITRLHHAARALRHLPVPVLARIHGFCLGAGLELATACALRLASRPSVFGMPEVLVGLPSVIEAALLPGLIGWGRTRRLLYLGERIEAAEAERWGLVERVMEDEAELDRAVEEWVQRLAGAGRRAVESQKRLVRRWENCGVDEGVQAGIEAFAEAFEDGGVEPKELMGRFLGRPK